MKKHPETFTVRMTESQNFSKHEERYHTPRWMVFFLDIVLSIMAMSAAYLLRFNFSIPSEWSAKLSLVFPLVIIVRGATFLIFRTFAGLIRYASSRDSERMLYVTSAGSGILLFINFISYVLTGGILLIPMSVLIIDFLILLFGLTVLRIFMKTSFYELFNKADDRKGVIIYGTDQAGLIVKHTLEREMGSQYRVICFMDEKTRIAGKKIEGLVVHDAGYLRSFLDKVPAHTLIFSKQPSSPEKKIDIVDTCLDFNMKVLSIPFISNWISSRLAYNQIKSVHIDDLLERTPFPVNKMRIGKLIKGRVVLVTGAAGSIGREITSQVAEYEPGTLILVDQAESPLYETESALKEKFNTGKIEVLAGNVADSIRMESLFKTRSPEVVFHAAAYKHIPMMENNPAEALRTNIFATRILAGLAGKYGCSQFIFVSTDKAVNPANIAGASKRIAELCLQDIQKTSRTNFSIVRFGNVLGSNGSVIPRFRKQIENGGPVTITHPDVKRYFMTSTIAAQLILEAGAMSTGGEIYVFEMGPSLRIYDLAKRMIKLTGLSPGQDIEIKFTGLRTGEKINEDLMYNHEFTAPTDNPKINLVLEQEPNPVVLTDKIDKLIALLPENDNKKIIAAFRDILPEFRRRPTAKHA
ncbi:MAG: nucleoside-diphosphate sugar epimerase/dehydratase [Bacteroidales bacterium]